MRYLRDMRSLALWSAVRHRIGTLLLTGAPLILALLTLSPVAPRDHADLAVRLAPERDPEVTARLFRIADTAGFPAALADLEILARDVGAVTAAVHGYAHALGLFAFVVHGDVRAAYAQCDDRFEYGCYHGVVRMAAQTLPGPDALRDLAGFCAEVRAVGGARAGRGSTCPHGFGHGVALRSDASFDAALAACDLLEEDLRPGCFTGVQMTFAHRGDGGPDRLAALCPTIEERHRAACHQAVLIGAYEVLHRPWSDLGALCASFPEPYRPGCLRTVGQLARDQHRAALDQAMEVCVIVTRSGPDRAACLDAVLQPLEDAPLESVLGVCAYFESEVDACHARAAAQVLQRLPADAERLPWCARLPTTHEERCRAGRE